MSRLVKEDGTFDLLQENLTWGLRKDLFFRAVRMPWPGILMRFLVAYLGLSILFALLFLAGGDCLEGVPQGAALKVFFYSAQTIATIGHEAIYPKTNYANALVGLESLVGIMCFAMFTGLCFAKFTLPSASVVFSSHCLVSRYEGRQALIVRIANERNIPITEARAFMAMTRTETTAEGIRVRRALDLPLIRERHPLFIHLWLLVHVIDEKSPFAGQTLETLAASNSDVFVGVFGQDGLFGQNVSAFRTYDDNTIRWGGQFCEIISTVAAGGARRVDYGRFDEILSDEEAAALGQERERDAADSYVGCC